MAKKKQITQLDYINAVKKADRELEIALYGKQISMRPTNIHKSKKVYDRKKMKMQSYAMYY